MDFSYKDLDDDKIAVGDLVRFRHAVNISAKDYQGRSFVLNRKPYYRVIAVNRKVNQLILKVEQAKGGSVIVPLSSFELVLKSCESEVDPVLASGSYAYHTLTQQYKIDLKAEFDKLSGFQLTPKPKEKPPEESRPRRLINRNRREDI